MKKLTAMDKGFLIGESRETPMHVCGVHLFTLPDRIVIATFGPRRYLRAGAGEPVEDVSQTSRWVRRANSE